MRRHVCACSIFLVVGCRDKSTPAPAASASTTPLASATIAPSASARALFAKPAGVVDASTVVEQWNTAHTKHDAAALSSLYDSRVEFYGQTLTSSQCVAKKKAAFDKDATYTQSIRDLKLTTNDKGGLTRARFTKTSTSHGKGTDYPSTLIIDARGLISVETDDVTDKNLSDLAAAADDWCLDGSLADGQEPNDKVKPPFTISARRATDGVIASKTFKAGADSVGPNHAYGIDQISCPANNCNPASGACTYDFRMIDPTMRGVTTSILVGWLHVDAVTGTITSDGNDRTEPLPPKAP
jgi:hypothetical protein